MMENINLISNSERVIQRISELRKLSLTLAIAGYDAGLFQFDIDKSGQPLPAEYEILNITRNRLSSRQIP